MTLENAIWCQAGFRGPTQCSGLCAKYWGYNKTPSPTTAIALVGKGVTCHFSSRDSECLIQGGKLLSP